ncbi:hypothetical protein C8035_v011189 [Colletotrichum spinosum]|uniref:Uncharacterized protein n=1 Tax=Colletotrichum spinosum TaxID=1347390 RepID=A0A4R8QI69_9PEZI|nr:hypothetical protein C8035_v011189 [Colletotrichum spinosum]
MPDRRLQVDGEVAARHRLAYADDGGIGTHPEPPISPANNYRSQAHGRDRKVSSIWTQRSIAGCLPIVYFRHHLQDMSRMISTFTASGLTRNRHDDDDDDDDKDKVNLPSSHCDLHRSALGAESP